MNTEPVLLDPSADSSERDNTKVLLIFDVGLAKQEENNLERSKATAGFLNKVSVIAVCGCDSVS